MNNSIGLKPGSDYSEKIRQLRGRLGLTQQSLADCLGVSFVTVNRWENGRFRPSKLARASILDFAAKHGIMVGPNLRVLSNGAADPTDS